MNTLAGCHLLVNRPDAKGQALARQVIAAGGKASLLPFIEIEAISADISAPQPNAIIFISEAAIRHGLALLPYNLSALTLYTVGQSSAKLLMEESNCQVNAPDNGFRSEELVELIQNTLPTKSKVLIVKGEGGRPYLQDTLEQNGYQTSTLDCYRRKQPDQLMARLLELFNSDAPNHLMANSEMALRPLLELAEQQPSIHSLPLLVASPRLAELAKHRHFSRVYLSSGPDNASIIKSLTACQG